MDKPVLHEAVARAIRSEIPLGRPYAVNLPSDYQAAAAAAVGVVLAEAKRSILAAIDASDDYYIGGYVNRELHKIVEAALAELTGEAP